MIFPGGNLSGAGAGLKKLTVLTSGTAAAFTPSAGVTALKVREYGASGGGGGVDGQGSGTAAIGAPGGNGSYTEKFFLTSGQTFFYTIGAAGAGGAAGANAGTSGGTTSFTASVDGTIQVTGGAGGAGVTGVASANGQISASGVPSGGDFSLTAGTGIYTSWISGTIYTFSNNGAPLFGGGASQLAVGNGIDSASLCAGGLGAFVAGADTANYAGGNGRAGLIIVEEY